MPAPSPLDKLAPQLATFAVEFADYGKPKEAAIKAGVHEDRAAIWARTALATPEVRQAIEHVTRAQFADAVPLAKAFIINLVKDERADRKLRLEAAKDLLNRGGYTSKDMRDAAAAVKDLHEMTREELLATLDGTEAELANRAKAIEAAPTIDASSHQVIDMED